MTTRSKALLVASHLAMAAGGLMLAGGPRGNPSGETAAETRAGTNGPQGPGGRDSQRATRSFRPVSEWRGSEYARAWKAVAAAKLSTPARLQLQRELLEKWAEVDLVAAIDAALAEAWDRDGAGYYDPSGPLLDSLSKAFAKDPGRVWEMLQGRQFGVATGMLRHVWLEAVGKADPLFLATRLGELSWRDREKAVSSCSRNLIRGSDTANQVFAALAGLPDDVVSAEMLLRLSDVIDVTADPEQLRDEILGERDERLAKMKANQWGRLLATRPLAEIQAEIGGLPDSVRAEVVWSAFRAAGTSERVIGLAGLLAEQGAWSKLEQRETAGRLQMIARDGAAREVADWATELPVRPETTELFHRSVDHYLRDNMETSRDWLADLTPGTWRDRAYAEYSQQALNAHNDPEASRWALDQIGDPAFKREAESWRSGWERRTGWSAR